MWLSLILLLLCSLGIAGIACRLRVVSGIQHSELIAHQVRSEQAALLSAVRQQQLAAEQAGYDAMLAQAAADAQSKVG